MCAVNFLDAVHLLSCKLEIRIHKYQYCTRTWIMQQLVGCTITPDRTLSGEGRQAGGLGGGLLRWGSGDILSCTSVSSDWRLPAITTVSLLILKPHIGMVWNDNIFQFKKRHAYLIQAGGISVSVVVSRGHWLVLVPSSQDCTVGSRFLLAMAKRQ